MALLIVKNASYDFESEAEDRWESKSAPDLSMY